MHAYFSERHSRSMKIRLTQAQGGNLGVIRSAPLGVDRQRIKD